MRKHGIKVLITDDDANLRELLTEAVRGWGYYVQSACDGKEALAMINSEKYDIFITDLMMPELGGMELLRLIIEANEDAQVIIITGNPDIGTEIEALESGACTYLPKPFRLDLLLVLLKKAGERVRMAAAAKDLRGRV